MSPKILLLEYDPRTVARVTEALAPLGGEVVAVRDIDAAVSTCASVEPAAVLITSVLPRVTVEDAITQLRALAGLRKTPFVVLMSGYNGNDAHVDAARLGAQAIVAKPIVTDELLGCVRGLLQQPRTSTAASAEVRAEVLDALRRGAKSQNEAPVTSRELFEEILREEGVSPSGLPRRPAAAADAGAPKPAGSASSAEKVVEDTLGELLAPPERVAKPLGPDTERSVDKLLEDTLSGLDIKGLLNRSKGAAAPAAPSGPAPAPQPPPQAPTAPPVQTAPPAVSLPAALERPPATAEAAPPAQARATMPPPPTPAPIAAPVAFGQYELIELISAGGMAEVFKARMRGVEGFQKIVAIKRILPHLTDNDEFVKMFIDEAKLAAQLQHPNITHIYDLGKIDRFYYIAMEYIDGKDLRSILQSLQNEARRMPLGLAFLIGSRVAAALDYAHRKRDLQGRPMGLVHRDVSPQNVLISFDGEIKLCDFGIVKAASKASHTRVGALKGKLQYMSPEQAWGKDIDHRSDIYSLGLVMYEMIVGRKAFSGDSEMSILEQVRAPHLVPPREVDPSLPPDAERVLLKALRIEREERYQTAAEFATTLAQMLQSQQPVPAAGELGSFLNELISRQRVSVPHPEAPPAPVPAQTSAPAQTAAEPTFEAAPLSLELTPPALEPTLSPLQAAPRVIVPRPVPARRSSPIVVVGGLAVLLAAAAAGLYFARSKGFFAKGAAAQATPAPETLALAKEAVKQEVSKQTQALRERLANEVGVQPTAATARAPAAVPAAAQPAAAVGAPAAQRIRPTPATVVAQGQSAPALAPAVQPTPVSAAAVQPERQSAPVAPTSVPQPANPAPVELQAPAVQEGELVQLDGEVTLPEPIYTPKPSYPPLAERQRVSGTVVLAVLVDENGAVREVKVLRGVKPDLGLDAAAVSAVQTWRYRPAVKNGVRVKVRITTAIGFRL